MEITNRIVANAVAAKNADGDEPVAKNYSLHDAKLTVAQAIKDADAEAYDVSTLISSAMKILSEKVQRMEGAHRELADALKAKDKKSIIEHLRKADGWLVTV